LAPSAVSRLGAGCERVCANGRTGSRAGEAGYKGVMRELIGDGREWRRELVAAVAVGVFFGLVGPFGTFLNDTAGMRIAYWVGMMVAGLVIYTPLMGLALGLGARLGQPVWLVLPAAVLLIAVPMSVLSAVTVVALWPRVGPHMRPIDWYGQAVILGLPLSTLAFWSRRAFPADRQRRPDPAPEVSNGDEARFLDRLPARLGRNLLCLEMEDHYVRAHTDRGSDLIHIPLKAAMAGLDVDGLQVHRSWWVARAAVAGVVQDGRRLKLRLVNGLEPPVSRSSIAVLRRAGWLEVFHSPESNRRRTADSNS
jgi:LytTr DNA-binding domain